MVEPSKELQLVFDKSIKDAQKLQHEYVTLEHLLYAMFCEENFLNVVTMFKTIINMGFNYFFSKLAAMNGIHILTANMFKHFDKVVYERNWGTLAKSQLWLIDIWGYLKDKKYGKAVKEKPVSVTETI